jgi:type IV pilus assembly protein PilZ
VDYGEDKALHADYLTDIGDGGLFIRTEARFEIGQTISVVLSVPGLLVPTKVRCIVRWISRTDAPGGGRRQTGVGVELVHESPEEQARLASLLARLQGEQQPVPRARASARCCSWTATTS